MKAPVFAILLTILLSYQIAHSQKLHPVVENGDTTKMAIDSHSAKFSCKDSIRIKSMVVMFSWFSDTVANEGLDFTLLLTINEGDHVMPQRTDSVKLFLANGKCVSVWNQTLNPSGVHNTSTFDCGTFLDSSQTVMLSESPVTHMVFTHGGIPISIELKPKTQRYIQETCKLLEPFIQPKTTG